MPYDDEALDTQGEVDVDDVSNDTDGNSDGGSDDQGNEPFLVVNDRQVYKTREDAIRGAQEAGATIARLSAWEKNLERYGVKDPQIASQLFDELIEARAKLAEAEKAAKTSSSDTSKTSTDDEADLSKEDKAALKWLQKHAPRLGFVPKEELQALKKEVEEMKASTTQSAEAAQESRRQSAIAEGRSAVSQFLSADKIDAGKQRVVETLMAAYINADDARVDKFHAGGAIQRDLLKEAYEEAKKDLGLGTSQQQQTATSAAVQKGKALQRNKTLPQTGSSNRGSRQNNDVRKDAAGRKDHIGSVHEKAWEIAQKHFTGTSAA